MPALPEMPTRNGKIVVEVPGFNSARSEVLGATAAQDTELLDVRPLADAKGRRHGCLRLRLPSAHLTALLNAVQAIGSLYSENIATTDHASEHEAPAQHRADLERDTQFNTRKVQLFEPGTLLPGQPHGNNPSGVCHQVVGLARASLGRQLAHAAGELAYGVVFTPLWLPLLPVCGCGWPGLSGSGRHFLLLTPAVSAVVSAVSAVVSAGPHLARSACLDRLSQTGILVREHFLGGTYARFVYRRNRADLDFDCPAAP